MVVVVVVVKLLTCRWAFLRWKSAGGKGSENKGAYNWWMGGEGDLILGDTLVPQVPRDLIPCSMSLLCFSQTDLQAHLLGDMPAAIHHLIHPRNETLQ